MVKGLFHTTCFAIFISHTALKRVRYSSCFMKSVKISACKKFLIVHSILYFAIFRADTPIYAPRKSMLSLACS